jgi:PAS domain S-box-containing protein
MAQKQARRPDSWNPSQLFLTLGVVTFILTSLVSSLLFIRTTTTFKWFNEASNTLSTLDALLIQMTTLESEVRGFALSGDESLVANYLRDSQVVTNQLTTLETLIQDNSIQAENARYLNVLVGKQQAAFYKLIRAARQNEGRKMAQLQGNHLMTAINAVVSLMRNSESSAIANHYADLQHKIFEFIVFLIAGSAASSSMLLFASRSTLRELTLRKRTEKHLSTSQAVLGQREMLLRSVFESVVDGIVVSDEEGVIVSWNRSAEYIFGYSASEAIGRNINLFIGSEHQSKHQDYVKRYLETGRGELMGKSREVNAKHS